MSEEVKDAAVSVPKAIVNSYMLNGLIGILFLVSYLVCLTDVNAALDDPSGYPFLWVFRKIFNSHATNTLTAFVLVLLFVGGISISMSTSRQTWAFARDHGLPFGKWVAHVDPKSDSPINAVLLTCAITIALALINIGSDAAFNAVVSLNVVALMLSYMMSISCFLHRRFFHPELIPRGRWSLGRYGPLVNLLGVLYSTFVFFWSFWPNTTPTDALNFNWSVLVFGVVLIGCGVDYFFRGRKVYTGPVVLVDGWKNE